MGEIPRFRLLLLEICIKKSLFRNKNRTQHSLCCSLQMGNEKKHKREKRKKEKKHHKKSKRRHSSPEAPKVEAPKVEAPRTEGPPAPKRARTDEADYSVPLPPGFTPPPAPMAPMTKQQWEAKQSVVRRVLDPQTGRHRCVLVT